MKYFLALLIVLNQFCFQLLPVMAEEETEAIPVKHGFLEMPKKVAGALCGITVGVPVRITKDIKHETRRMAGVLRNDFGNEFGLTTSIVVMSMCVPYGIASGLIKGSIQGVQYGIAYGTKEPFSKESFGLNDYNDQSASNSD